MAKNEPTGKKPSPRKQRPDAPAVSDNPHRPKMGERDVAPRRIDRRIVRMADDPVRPKPRGATMSRFRRRESRERDPEDLKPQQERKPEAAAEQQGYLRLRLHVEDGETSIRSARFVPGPFEPAEEVSPGLTYEARVGRRRVAHGDVPDPTVERGFADPAGRKGLEGHQVVDVDTYDFTVRVPAGALDEAGLPDFNVSLYSWRGRGPGDHIAIGELSAQPKRSRREVARLDGRAIEDVPAKLRRDLRKAFKEASG